MILLFSLLLYQLLTTLQQLLQINMNSQNNPFAKINTVNSQPSLAPLSSTQRTNTAISNNLFTIQKTTPIQAPSVNPINPLSQSRALPQTSPAPNPFAALTNNSTNRPLNHQPNMSITSSQSFNGNMAQKGNFVQPSLSSDMKQPQLSVSQVPRMKQPYPIISNPHLAINLPQPLNSKVKNPANTPPSLKTNSRIKCISAIEENLKNQKNKEMLRVDYYTLKNHPQMVQNQGNLLNGFNNASFNNNQNRSGLLNLQPSIPTQISAFGSNANTSSGNVNVFGSKPMQQMNPQVDSQPNLFGSNQNTPNLLQSQKNSSFFNQSYNSNPLKSSSVYSSHNNSNPFESQMTHSNIFARPAYNDGNERLRTLSMMQSQIAEPISRFNKSIYDPLDHPSRNQNQSQQKSLLAPQNADKINHAELLRMIARVNNLHDPYQSHFKEQSYAVIVDLRKKYFYLLELQAKNQQEWQGNAFPLGLKKDVDESESWLDRVIQEKLGELFGKSRQNIDYLIEVNRPLVNLILEKRHEIEIYLTRKIIQCLSQSPPPYFLHANQGDAFKRKKKHLEESRMQDESQQSITSLNNPFGSNWFGTEQVQQSFQKPKMSKKYEWDRNFCKFE